MPVNDAPNKPKTNEDSGSAQQARILPDEQQLIARGVTPGDGLAAPSPTIGPSQESAVAQPDTQRQSGGDLPEYVKEEAKNLGLLQRLKDASAGLDNSSKSLIGKLQDAAEITSPDRTPGMDKSRDHGPSR